MSTDQAAQQAWDALVVAAKAWAEHMDQWEKIKFQNSIGTTVYVTMSLRDAYPDSFDQV